MKKLLSLLACLLSTQHISAFAAMDPTTQSKTFTLQTNAFRNLGSIPARYSCDGEDISPNLTWQNIPAKTQTFALIFSDPDAPMGNFYHWVLYNIPKTITQLPEGVTNFPQGILIGKNSWGKQQYNGPCPPKGSEHRYLLTLYALDSTLTLSAGADAETLMAAMQNHIIAKASISGTFKH